MTVAAWTRASQAWIGTVGRAALERAVPAWAGVAVVAAAIFGGNGLRPHHVAQIATSTPLVIAVCALGWAILLTPAVRAAWSAPGTSYLRTLPGARALAALALGVVALVVHAPWGALAIAASPVVGAATWLALAAVTLAVAAALARITPRLRRPRWSSPLAALVGVHTRAIVRRRGGSVTFALGLAVLGGALGAALIDGEDLGSGAAATLPAACAAVVAACALAAIDGATVDDRRALGAWIAAAAPGPGSIAGATLVVSAVAGIACATTVGAVVAVVARPAVTIAIAIVGACAATGLGVGLAMAGVAERALAVTRPAGAIAAGAGVVAILAVIAIGLAEMLGVAVVVGLGAAAAVGAPRR